MLVLDGLGNISGLVEDIIMATIEKLAEWQFVNYEDSSRSVEKPQHRSIRNGNMIVV